MHKLSDNTTYKRFVNSRDQALETLLRNAMVRLNNEYAHIMHLVRDAATICAHRVTPGDLVSSHSAVRDMDHKLRYDFHSIAANIDAINHKLMRTSFAFSYAGESQAIYNTGAGKEETSKLGGTDLMRLMRDSKYGDIGARTRLYLNRIIRKVSDAMELGISMEETPKDLLARVMATFKRPQVRKQVLAISRLKETAAEGRRMMGFEWLTDDEWESVLEAYKSAYVPEWRGIGSEDLEYPMAAYQEGEYILHGWEVENDLVERFVEQVRAGESAAAKAAGITDFVWIAIVDNKTDECCLWRDGLTTTEIEARLSQGMDEDCEHSASPPIHYNCRCRLAGATEDLPERPDDGQAEFDAWLNS